MMLLESYSVGVSRGVKGVAHSSVFSGGASLSGGDSHSEASNFGISNPHGLDGGIVHDASVYSNAVIIENVSVSLIQRIKANLWG